MSKMQKKGMQMGARDMENCGMSNGDQGECIQFSWWIKA